MRRAGLSRSSSSAGGARFRVRISQPVGRPNWTKPNSAAVRVLETTGRRFATLVRTAMAPHRRSLAASRPRTNRRRTHASLGQVPGSTCVLLAPIDNLLQVAVHTAKHSLRARTRISAAHGRRSHRHTRSDGLGRISWPNVKSRELKTAVYFALRIPPNCSTRPSRKFLAELHRPAMERRPLSRQLLRAGLLYPIDRNSATRLHCLQCAAVRQLAGLWRGLFPATDWMRQRYQAEGFRLYPAYFQRIVALACRRTKT